MFTQGFSVNGEHSFADHGLYIQKRTIGLPKKNSIRKTIPFMNGYYDFTRINGSDTWGERELSYTFDIIGETVEETDAECTRILNWLCNIHDSDIYDDTMPDWHFHGSFESATPSESECGEKNELTVTFVCYPFKIANRDTEIEIDGSFAFKNAGQPVRPVVVSDGSATVTIGNYYATISAGETLFGIVLPSGNVTGTVEKTNATRVSFKWRSEVL